MFVHDIDTHTLLLVLVNLQLIGKFLQLVKFVVGNRLVFEVKLLERIVILLVLFVNQLDQIKRAAVTKHIVDFVQQVGIITKTDILGTLQRLAE